jgi:hypothetical protein
VAHKNHVPGESASDHFRSEQVKVEVDSAGTSGLMSAAEDVYTGAMKIVKYFALAALAAATLAASACCLGEKPPPPPPPPAPTGK